MAGAVGAAAVVVVGPLAALPAVAASSAGGYAGRKLSEHATGVAAKPKQVSTAEDPMPSGMDAAAVVS